MPCEDFKVGDPVLLRHPNEFYRYFGNLQARKGLDGPFTIKKMVEYHVVEEEPTPKRFKGGC